jgi:uncharacterized protein
VFLCAPLCPLWLFLFVAFLSENILVPTQTGNVPQLRFSLLPGRFAICRLDPATGIPDWALRPATFTSISRSTEELSIVCPENHIPSGLKSDAGWICLKLEGPFPFSMTGVLASFINPLSSNKIPIFAIATFDTDYVLIKQEFWEAASAALEAAGHETTS